MTQANGDTYQGQWLNGMANGYGTFVDSQGSTYEGEWMDDLQNGYGCETWSQGKIKFEGNYVMGKKKGKGRYEWQMAATTRVTLRTACSRAKVSFTRV